MRTDMPGEPGSGADDLPSRETVEAEWQRAEQRALLYLRSLHVHPRRALELVLEALRAAEQGPGRSPLAATMRELRSLLLSQGAAHWSPRGGLREDGGPLPEVQAAPPIHRGTMVPLDLDRRPWLTFLERSLKGIRSLTARLIPGRKPRSNSAGLPAAGAGGNQEAP